MKKVSLVFTLVLCCALTTISCKKKQDGDTVSKNEVHNHDEDMVIPMDSTQIDPFFAKYPKFKEYSKEVHALYKKHDYHYIWHDKKGLLDFAEVLYNRVNQFHEEGLQNEVPYKEEISDLFNNPERGDKPDTQSELLISSMYFYFTTKLYQGIDQQKSKELGWYLPRERVDYVAYLDTLMKDPKRIKEDKSELFSQYYNLKKGLEKYRDIQKKGGWGTVTLAEGVKALKPGDSSATVAQLRSRLVAEGYMGSDSKSTLYDDDLKKGLTNYEARHNREFNGFVTPALIKELNVPVADRIKTLTVNMERCRWISPDIEKSPEFIAVNIPSFRLHYFRDGKPFLISKVVVGKELNKTVVFSGQMSYLVFSPYWNIPKSIIAKEIKPGMAKDPNYLSKHNMDWNNGQVRQKPGKKNSLGLVKFMFPNSNNIYLHDTPAKSLFNQDERAFSHGCVRVERARDLAIAITKKDGNWTEKRVDAAMNAGKESYYTLKHKIPVFIGYFTAWADNDGNVAFFDDVYKRDDRLASLLYAAK
jgi:murein L,D-transpeptidase YcbB/YkuD